MSLRVGVVCHDSVGGSARVAIELARALGGRGHEIHLFTRRAPLGRGDAPPGVTLHPLLDEQTERRAATPHLDTEWLPAEIDALAARVAAVARETHLDVLHFHYAVPFAEVAVRVTRTLGTTGPALVGTLHGTDVSVLGRRPGMRRELAKLLPQLDALTTVSESHAELAMRTFHLAERPQVIPNFVDVERFRPDPPRVHERRPRIVHVSNFRKIKQPLAMVRIFCEVRRHHPADLWLVGDGEGMTRVRRTIDAAGLMGDTRLFGLRLDVERVLPEADVLLVTSRAESFCLAALEAAACGLPVVAPRVGGLPETVDDGRTGLLYDPGDEAGAVRAICSLLAEDEVRAQTSAAAVARAHELSTATVVPRYEDLYGEVLGTMREAGADLQATSAA